MARLANVSNVSGPARRRAGRPRHLRRLAAEPLEDRTLLAVDSIAQLGVAATESFDGMGSGTTLPAAFRMVERNAATVSWSTASSAVSQQANSGSPTAGGTYNWGAAATDRAVGAMSSGSWASPNSLLVRFTNDTGSTITSLSVSYAAERYRVNSAAASVSLFSSAEGTTWTPVPAGDVAATNFPAAPSAYTFATGTRVTRTDVAVGSLSLTPGGAFFLRWQIDTTGSNSQGIGIDDVSITAFGDVVTPPDAVTLFADDFATLVSGNSTSTGGSSTAWGGGPNWPAVTRAYEAGGAVRLGTGSASGSITTRAIDLSGAGGAFTVSFDVKGWMTVEGDLTVTVTDLVPRTVSYTASMAAAFVRQTLSFMGGRPGATITFATTAQRAFLDNVVVTGGAPAPQVGSVTGFVWNDADGDGTWDAPAESGISGRTVYLDLDRDGAREGGEPTATTAADGSYAFTDLAAGAYVVAQVVPPGWEQTAPALIATGSRSVSVAALAGTLADPAYAPSVRQQQRRLVPNDPLFAQQWHLRNTGQQSGTAGEDARVVTAWDTARGTGVVIGVVDDGLQHAHPDLAPGYRADLSYDFNDADADPAPGAGNDHGTAVAGVAAARGDNGIGVAGVAPSAALAGLRLIAAATTDQQEAAGLTHRPQEIAIYANSWGPLDDGTTLEAPGPLTRAALADAVQTGRQGKGSIYVWAAGNGLQAGDNSNYDGYANSRYTIAVTAVDNRGRQAWYAEPGANILVAAPSSGDSSGSDVGIVTTDRTGANGYNATGTASGNLADLGYTNDFGGTSSAAPAVAGVVALMLDANPDLGWRDVQHVLAGSARRNDPADTDWSRNGAGRWVNHKYGFGVVDATAAVNLASTWTTVGPETSVGSGTITVGQSIPDGSAAGITSSFTMAAGVLVESVEVTLSATHASRGQLQVVLTSPAGTRSVLAERHADSGDHYAGWVFSTVRHWGESAAGTWTLTVADLTGGTTGTFGSWALGVHGTSLEPPPGTRLVTVVAGQASSDVNFATRSTLAQLGTTGTLSGVATTYGLASAVTTVSVTGTNLAGSVTATAPAGFQVSSDGVTFGTTATFTAAGGVVSGTLSVRLGATTGAGTHAGNVTLAADGATSVVVAVPSSTVSPKALTVRADDKTKVVNTANPALTATIMGFVNGETAATVVTGAAALETTALSGSAVGSYPITVGVGTLAAAGGNYTFTTLVNGTLTVTNAPVKVTGVYVKGTTGSGVTGWQANYLGLAPFTTLGSDRLGWQLRDGAAQLATTTAAGAGQVTWNNVNTISVRFDQAISAPQAAALRLVAGTGNRTIEPTSVTRLASNTVAQFVLPEALVTGKYLVSIAASAIQDAAGTTMLDGEWTTSSSTFAAGSGDGTAGGMFNFAFQVLVGDVNTNGTANASDVSNMRLQITRALGDAPTAATFRYDLNGNNVINSSDVSNLRLVVTTALGTNLNAFAAALAPTAGLATIGPVQATLVTASGARLGATVTGDGGEPVLERGVVVLADATGTPEAGDAAALTLVSPGGTGAFTVDVTGLAASSVHRFRAFVRTSRGLVYSAIDTFTTAAAG